MLCEKDEGIWEEQKYDHLRENLQCLTEKVIFSVSLRMIKSLTEGKGRRKYFRQRDKDK